MNKVLKYVISVLVIVAFALGGFYFGKKTAETENLMDSKGEPVKETTGVKDEIISKAQEMVDKKLSKNFGVYTFISGDWSGDINNLPNDKKLEMAYWYLKDDQNMKQLDAYTSDEILLEFQKLFGSDYTIEFKDIKNPSNNGVIYKFDTTTKKYVSTGENGSGAIYPILNVAKSKYINSKEENGMYIVTFRQMLYAPDGGGINYYNFKGKVLFSKDYDEGETVDDEIFAKYEKELVDTDYTFELINSPLINSNV